MSLRIITLVQFCTSVGEHCHIVALEYFYNLGFLAGVAQIHMTALALVNIAALVLWNIVAWAHLYILALAHFHIVALVLTLVPVRKGKSVIIP